MPWRLHDRSLPETSATIARRMQWLRPHPQPPQQQPAPSVTSPPPHLVDNKNSRAFAPTKLPAVRRASHRRRPCGPCLLVEAPAGGSSWRRRRW
eukprot:306381-Chlamydomonas_euryale.AAC.2